MNTYHFNIDRDLALDKKIRDNVFLVNNYSVVHQNAKFIFSTLWSEISPSHEWEIQRGMNDFNLIKYGQHRLTPFHVNEIHRECRKFVVDALELREAEKVVVVTHHVPTFMNYPPKYRNSSLNEAFAVELYDLIEQSNADYWIYGHHHQSIADFKIGNTVLTANQLGYVEHNEHRDFSVSRIIEL
jgi:hypothetical protein